MLRLFLLDLSVLYYYTTGMETQRSQLECKRPELLSQLLALGPWLDGSLVALQRRCGKKSCSCHHGGPGHPALYLTWKENGKTVSLYIPRKMEDEVRGWVDNYKRAKDLLRQLAETQKAIVRLRE
jgi:hypothetical protein